MTHTLIHFNYISQNFIQYTPTGGHSRQTMQFFSIPSCGNEGERNDRMSLLPEQTILS